MREFSKMFMKKIGIGLLLGVNFAQSTDMPSRTEEERIRIVQESEDKQRKIAELYEKQKRGLTKQVLAIICFYEENNPKK